MITIGVDIEQFVTDPYGSGIQRVLQYLAREWPTDLAAGVFVVPREDEFLLLSPEQAAELVGIAFAPQRSDDLRIDVSDHINTLEESVFRVSQAEVLAQIDAWLLPEVSYLASVLHRFESMSTTIPTAMVGYDALPMTEPGNYRFPPGVAANASEYFRLLASTDALICISDYSRQMILKRLRRSKYLITTIAHPGGDHVEIRRSREKDASKPAQFLRLGTMEARKMPLEILRAFLAIRDSGVDARLTYVGAPSSSYEWINEELRAAVGRNVGFTWITQASDREVVNVMRESDVFLSFGTEGYGIPVLEAIRQGMPVLFGGIQPAAELMRNQGAIDCGEPSQDSIQTALSHYSDRTAMETAVRAVNPQAVPTWRDFARGVVEPIITATRIIP